MCGRRRRGLKLNFRETWPTQKIFMSPSGFVGFRALKQGQAGTLPRVGPISRTQRLKLV